MDALSFELEWQAGAFRLEAAARVAAPVTALLGSSGSGKTSLLRLLAGLERPSSGRVELGDRPLDGPGLHVPPWRRGVGLVFQEPRLWPHRSVAEIIRYGGRHEEALVVERLELAPLMERSPSSLSGGEQQRVALARALCAGPRALLVDEPVSGLDAARRRRVWQLLVGVSRDLDIPLLLATHHTAEALEHADELLLLERGRLLGAGPIDDLLREPEAFRTLDGLGLVSVLEVEVLGHAGTIRARLADQELVLPPGGPPAGTRGKVTIRVEDVLLARERLEGLSARNQLRGTVAEVAEAADRLLITLALDGGPRLRAEITHAAAAELGIEPGRELWALAKTWAFRWRP